MKLTVAIVAALSAGKALAFVPTYSFGGSTSTTKASTSANKCNLRMNAAGEEGATGMGPVVAEQQPMGRKQMLQSVAATGLSAILFGAQASPSFAADVDYSKVSARGAGDGSTCNLLESRLLSGFVPSNAVQSAKQPPPMGKGTLTPESVKLHVLCEGITCGSPSRPCSCALRRNIIIFQNSRTGTCGEQIKPGRDNRCVRVVTSIHLTEFGVD